MEIHITWIHFFALTCFLSTVLSADIPGYEPEPASYVLPASYFILETSPTTAARNGASSITVVAYTLPAGAASTASSSPAPAAYSLASTGQALSPTTSTQITQMSTVLNAPTSSSTSSTEIRSGQSQTTASIAYPLNLSISENTTSVSLPTQLPQTYNIVQLATTICSAGQTVTRSGKPTVLAAPSTSAYLSTSILTKNVACTEITPGLSTSATFTNIAVSAAAQSYVQVNIPIVYSVGASAKGTQTVPLPAPTSGVRNTATFSAPASMMTASTGPALSQISDGFASTVAIVHASGTMNTRPASTNTMTPFNPNSAPSTSRYSFISAIVSMVIAALSFGWLL